MSLTVTVNDILIPDEDILKYPKSKESIAFENNKMLPDTIEILLTNSDPTIYDDRYSGSLFFGTSFFGDIVSVFDNDINRYTFEGKLKDIPIKEQKQTIKLVATNYIDDLAKRTCIYSNAINKTIAEIIYEILTDVGGIPASNIVYAGFQNAINIQAANTAYINIDYDANTKKSCIAVVNELLRISQCHVYTYQNLIYMYQWQPWGGQFGTDLKKKNVITKSYEHFYSQKDIVNYYRIGYDNAGTIAWESDSDAESIARFGERRFDVPNQKVDSTTSTDFKIHFRNQAGAAWAGDLAIERYKNIQKFCEMVIGSEMEFVPVADQLDLRFTPFVGEPVQIVEREYDKDKDIITVKALFLNTPEVYYVRDSEPPAAPELVSAIPLEDGGILLKWTESQEADWLGYKVYFSSSPGEWEVESCNFGRSGIDRKITQQTPDGYIYEIIYQLNIGTEYSFYVASYDTSFNESGPSNIEKAIPFLDTVDFNMYRCQGNIYSAITLDLNNTLSGSVPDGFNKYSDGDDYGSKDYQPAAFYESGQYYDEDGFTLFSFRGQADPGDITYQYRTSDDDITYTAWTAEADAIGNVDVTLSSVKYFQYRFIFRSTNWGDTDSIYLKELE